MEVMDLLQNLDLQKKSRQRRHHCAITLLPHDNIDVLIIIDDPYPKNYIYNTIQVKIIQSTI